MGLKLAIVGATGLVGQELINIMNALQPRLDRVGLFASEAGAGTQFTVLDAVLNVTPLPECDFASFDAAFFCVGDELSAHYVPLALKTGCAVVDKSNAFRLQPGVPLIVAGVNDNAVTGQDTLVANPNCTTIVLVHALAPLQRRFGLEQVFAATYQSATGAGRRGGEALCAGIARAEVDSRTWRPIGIDAAGPAYNVLARIGPLDQQGRAAEEAKLVEESRKIFGQPSLPFVAHAVRVPVLVGHSIAATVKLSQPATEADLRSAWEADKDVCYRDAECPTPVSSATHDQVEVGRLRSEAGLERSWSFFVSGDNLRIGAALNGWRILQLIERIGIVPAFSTRQGGIDA